MLNIRNDLVGSTAVMAAEVMPLAELTTLPVCTFLTSARRQDAAVKVLPPTVFDRVYSAAAAVTDAVCSSTAATSRHSSRRRRAAAGGRPGGPGARSTFRT